MDLDEDEVDDLLEDLGIEFDFYASLSSTEKIFYEEVLLRGERKGLWKVWRFSAGGKGEKRGIMGVDFVIQDMRTGVIELIELKHSNNIIFTPDQLIRFRMDEDSPKRATRLCAIIPYQKDSKNFATRVFFWSPKFIKAISKEFFTAHRRSGRDSDSKSTRGSYPDQERVSIGLNYSGLGDCLNQNKENCLYEIKGYGEFGDTSTRYKTYDMDYVYNWLFNKLVTTIQNPLEESDKDYIPCEISDDFREVAKLLILEYLKTSYRLLYAEDFFEVFRKKYPDRFSIREKVIKGDKRWKKAFINDTQASTYVHRRIKDLQREGHIITLKRKDYRFKCYGLKNYKKFYIPLSKGASKLLDYLKEGWEIKGDVEFELVTLARILDLKGGFSSISERERISAFEVPSYREELVSHNLIEDLGTHPVSVRITEKGLKYFIWNSNNPN